MAKGTRCGLSRSDRTGFFCGTRGRIEFKQEEIMKNSKGILSYRRRCRRLGQGTGLSHYILLTPKASK